MSGTSRPSSDIRRVLLVINPMSRRGVRRRGRAVEAFRKAGVTVTELLTSHPGHAREVIAARREVWDAVFVLGGDGTVMEVVGALARSGIPVGVLPGGTGNLVAGVLGVPGNIRKAVAALLNGGRGVLDLGQLPDERYFAFAAGVGIDVAMVERTTHSEKRFLGMLSYALTAARAAFGRQAIDLTATVDGVVVRERVILAMVANAGSIFRDRFSVGPEVKPDDGELDLCLFAPVTTGDVFSLLWRILRKDFRPHRRMRFIRGKQFELATEPPVTVQADGDLVGRTPIQLNVVPGAATFLLPAAR